MEAISKWLSKHKTVLSLSAVSIPFIYYSYTMRKKMRKTKKNMSIIEPLIAFKPAHDDNDPNSQSLSHFLYDILSHKEVLNNIEQCLYETITSNEMKTEVKGFGLKLVEAISTNHILLQELKAKLTEIAMSKELKRESDKFIQLIKRDVSLQNESASFIERILNDPSVIESLNQMAKESCYKAIESQKVIDDFNLLAKEILSNEELIKFIYNKATDIFTTTTNGFAANDTIKDNESMMGDNESYRL